MVMLSGTPGAEAEEQQGCCSWFHVPVFRSSHSIKGNAYVKAKLGCPHDDLVGKAALNTKAALQTSLGGKKQHHFLGPGLASHPHQRRP